MTCALSVTISIAPAAIRLSHRTAEALAAAGDDGALLLVADRVIGSDRFLEIARDGDGLVARLTPFAELVLLEVADAAVTTLGPAARADWIRTALARAGYHG